MGQAISSFIKSIDRTDEKKKEVDDALGAMMTLAKAKRDLFYSRIQSSVSQPLTIPIEKIIVSREAIFCQTSTEGTGVKDAVQSLLGSVADGNFMDGISKTATVLVDALLGSYSGSESEVVNYTIVADVMGGLARIDYYMYSYKYTSKGLIDTLQNVMIVCLVISSAQIKELSRNTVMAIVANKYQTDTEPGKEEARKLINIIMTNVNAANGLPAPTPLGPTLRLMAAAPRSGITDHHSREPPADEDADRDGGAVGVSDPTRPPRLLASAAASPLGIAADAHFGGSGGAIWPA